MDGALVGRDREVAALTRWLDDAAAGSGRLAVVSGDAGVGKTALAAAVADRAAAMGMLVGWGRASEGTGAPPFWPWRQILRALDRRDPLADAADVDEPQDRFARFEEVVDELRAAALATGALVVVDDLHWADESTLRLTEHVAGRLEGLGALVVVTARSTAADQGPGLATTLVAVRRSARSHEVRVEGLDRAGVATLLDGAPDDVVARVAGATGGNPLFVGEIARHLAAGGDVEAVPTSVRDLVADRLARRTPACADVLRAAAVAGHDFAAGLVATALGRPALACLAAMDEATASGLVEPVPERPGSFRFVHDVVRDAVDASLGEVARAALHRRFADAIVAYEGVDDDRLADIARHWDAAAALGERLTAAAWVERAADAAERRLAWEDAARLYDRAAELGGAEAEPVDRHRRLLGAARTFAATDLGAAVRRAVQAAGAVDDDRPDLVADAALVLEDRGGSVLAGDVVALCERALAVVDPGDDALRARLLSQLATGAFYRAPERLEALSAEALALATRSGDPRALVGAARARQLVATGPDRAAERVELATTVVEAGRALGRPATQLWGHLWRIDAFADLGRLGELAAEVVPLRRCVERAPTPVNRWHRARCEALVAQLTGRFADGEAHALEARSLYASFEDRDGAEAMWLAYRGDVSMHVGVDDALVAGWLELERASTPPEFLGDLPVFGPALALARQGDLAGAVQRYDTLAAVDGWRTPPFLRVSLLALRTMLAIELGRLDDVALLHRDLSAHRGQHVGDGAGALTYLGPVELWLGTAASRLGWSDDAVADLERARAATASGSPPFEVHAAVELADALLARDDAGDADRARHLLAVAVPRADAMGMRPWAERGRALLSTDRESSTGGVLSPREEEVAALVAVGRTNRQIAAELYISERTAQNHVQHILTKLGAANRTEIAAWWSNRSAPR